MDDPDAISPTLQKFKNNHRQIYPSQFAITQVTVEIFTGALKSIVKDSVSRTTVTKDREKQL